MNDAQRAILKTMRENGGLFYVSDAAAMTGINPSTVSSALASLFQNGLITRNDDLRNRFEYMALPEDIFKTNH